MNEMTVKDYEELVKLLDGRIDELTKPIPSKQILRFAEAIRSATVNDDDSEGSFSEDDYSNLLQAQIIVNEVLPQIMENIRAYSINPNTGWRFETVSEGNGDADLCAICRKPFQHFNWTVKVHYFDMHPDAYQGVCRECVQQYAPIEFVESDGVEDWVTLNRYVCEKIEKDNKTEGQRVALIDAIRKHAHTTHYFSTIAQQSSEWAKGAFGEWR
jgi:hypothetical protein